MTDFVEDLIIAFIVVFGLFGLLHCMVGFISLMDRKSRLDGDDKEG